METVDSMLELLARIAITIRRSGTRSRLQKADRKFKLEDHSDLQQHLVTVMLSQGPFSANHSFSRDQIDASMLTSVQWRLINCNLKRRNRFLYAQQHSKALDAPSHNPMPVTQALASQQDVAAPAIPKQEPQGAPTEPLPTKPAQKLPVPSVALATSASGITDLPASLPVLPQGRPVSSRATGTQLSTTVIKLAYPHPPKIKTNALFFRCPCCCQTLPVGISDKTRWK